METKTVRTPAIINIAFLSLLIIPVIFFMIGRVSAHNLREQYCANQFNLMFMQQVSPMVQVRCGKIFEKKTQDWMNGLYPNNH